MVSVKLLTKQKSIETYISCGNFGTYILTIASIFFCYDILPFVDTMYQKNMGIEKNTHTFF